jgi:hypothetical protein
VEALTKTRAEFIQEGKEGVASQRGELCGGVGVPLWKTMSFPGTREDIKYSVLCCLVSDWQETSLTPLDAGRRGVVAVQNGVPHRGQDRDGTARFK